MLTQNAAGGALAGGSNARPATRGPGSQTGAASDDTLQNPPAASRPRGRIVTSRRNQIHTRLLAAALAAVFPLALPGAASAQHGGHSSGGRTHGHASTPTSNPGSHASPFHSAPYYLLRLQQQDQRSGLYLAYPAGYPYYYFNPGGYLDPYCFYSPSPPFLYGSPFYGSSVPTGATETSSVLQRAAPASIGEVRLRINPGGAAVLMDGVDVGTADDYSGAAKLALVAGLHHFELRAPGYHTLVFDVDVRPGHVIPYQGILQPAR